MPRLKNKECLNLKRKWKRLSISHLIKKFLHLEHYSGIVGPNCYDRFFRTTTKWRWFGNVCPHYRSSNVYASILYRINATLKWPRGNSYFILLLVKKCKRSCSIIVIKFHIKGPQRRLGHHLLSETGFYQCEAKNHENALSDPDLLSRPLKRTRDQDQDLGHQVSRPRLRPWPPGVETKTKTLATRSRDQDLGNQVSRSRSC